MNLNSNSVEAMISNIVTVVLKIHFYYVTNYDLIQDLTQEGYLKAYELLAEGNYDPNKNLRTFIYTGVRNAMTNYLYHHKKETHTDLDTISTPNWQNYEKITLDGYWKNKVYNDSDDTISSYEVDLTIVYNICDKYSMFGDYLDIILKELKKTGIYSGPVNKSTIICIPTVRDAILGEIYWDMFKK